MIERADRQVSDVARNAFDFDNKVIGTIGAGRVGYCVLQCLKPFNLKELRPCFPSGRQRRVLPQQTYLFFTAVAQVVDTRRVDDLKEFVSQCDVVTVDGSLHKGTIGFVNAEVLS